MESRSANPVPAARALLVHGLGSSPAWWAPLAPAFRRAGLQPHPLDLPPLEDAGPETWCAEVLRHLAPEPVVLVGHSLGAAVCSEVARHHAVVALVLLACPPFVPGYDPPPPPVSGLPAEAVRRVGRFLRQACDHAAGVQARSVHFVGALDRWVPVEQARRLPFPLIVIPGAGHGLNRSAAFAHALEQHLAKIPSTRSSRTVG